MKACKSKTAFNKCDSNDQVKWVLLSLDSSLELLEKSFYLPLAKVHRTVLPGQSLQIPSVKTELEIIRVIPLGGYGACSLQPTPLDTCVP